MKLKKMTVTEIAEKIQIEIDSKPVEEYTSGHPIRLAKKFSRGDKILALAAYLKWDMPSMTGVDDQEWLLTAKTCRKILEVKR